jgi:A/G-specific adenine glycosylase
MDFGAVVCKPQQPACLQCPLSAKCVAFKQQLVAQLPVKTKKLVIKKRYFYYIVLEYKDQVYIRKRTDSDIWQNLHEFILIEMPGPVNANELEAYTAFKEVMHNIPCTVQGISPAFKQQLTHQTIYSQFILLTVAKAPDLADYMAVPRARLNSYAFPKTITDFLQNKSLGLF